MRPRSLYPAALLIAALLIVPAVAEDTNATTVETTATATATATETTATATATATATTVSAPAANFYMNITDGTVPLSVQFTDSSTNSPTAWYWDFGDGNTSTSQSPVHTYEVNGTFTVSLTATNAGGSDTYSLASVISVAANDTDTTSTTVTEPVAAFTVNVTSGTEPLSVQFTDDSTNTPTSWYWLFGDGEYDAVNQSPNHTYTSSGTFTVTFTATNDAGSNTTTGTITVTAATATETTATTAATTVATTVATAKQVTTVATSSVAKSSTQSASDFLAEQKAAREAADAQAAATEESPLPPVLVLGALATGSVLAAMKRT